MSVHCYQWILLNMQLYEPVSGGAVCSQECWLFLKLACQVLYLFLKRL